MPKDLDVLARDYLAPALRKHGFRRAGRTFKFKNQAGDLAWMKLSYGLLAGRPHFDKIYFDLVMGVAPALYIEMEKAVGGLSMAPWYANVYPPLEFVQHTAPVPGDGGVARIQVVPTPDPSQRRIRDWAFDPDPAAPHGLPACGEVLAREAEAAVPGLMKMLAREALLKVAFDPNFPAPAGVPRRLLGATLLASEGPSPELSALLDRFPDDSPWKRWLAAYVSAGAD